MIAKNTVCLWYERDSVPCSARPLPAAVAFNIEHERDGGLNELEFQLRWHTER